MIHAIRIARFQFHSHSMMQRSQQQIHHSYSSWARETATAARITISSTQSSSSSTTTATTQLPENKDQQQQNNPLDRTPSGDVMAQAFGVEYSTRSAEEGFGGIYGGNEDEPPSADPDNNQQAAAHHDSPIEQDEYYKTQESEVKVQEKAMQEPDKMGTS